jgi:hypothetical protein
VRGVAVLALAVAAVAGRSDAQSLGDVARREQEKKKDAPASPAPTYTEADLKAKRTKSKGTVSHLPATGARKIMGAEASPGAAPSPEPSPGASPPPDPSPSPDPATDRANEEREWRIRFADARTRVAEAEARAWEERIEVVYVSGVPVQQKVRVKADTPELQAAKQALLDLEDALRRAGGLPGWARD